MAKILIYTKEHCHYCTRAKSFFDAKNISYEEIRIDIHPEKRVEMEHLSGRRTVPQIFINGKSIGGCDDLMALAKSQQLAEILK